MKKILITFVVGLLLTCTSTIHASAGNGVCLDCTIEETKYVSGYINNNLNVNIVILGGDYTFVINDEYDIENVDVFFENLPQGLHASIYDYDESSVTIKITGTPVSPSDNKLLLLFPSIFICNNGIPTEDTFGIEGNPDNNDLKPFPDPDEMPLFYSDVTNNNCWFFDIKEPSIDCEPTTIKKKVNEDINQDITISLTGSNIDHFKDNIAEQEFNGLLIKFKETIVNELQSLLVLNVSGKMHSPGQTAIQVPVITDLESPIERNYTTNNSCLILEVEEEEIIEEEPPVIIPESPKKKKHKETFTPPSTGIY